MTRVLAASRHPIKSTVRQVDMTPVSACVGGNERRLNVSVQLRQVDIGQDRAEDGGLRAATISGMIPPVFQIPRPQQCFHEIQEPSVVDVLAQDRQQCRMVEAVKTLGTIALDKPRGSNPVV